MKLCSIATCRKPVGTKDIFYIDRTGRNQSFCSIDCKMAWVKAESFS